MAKYCILRKSESPASQTTASTVPNTTAYCETGNQESGIQYLVLLLLRNWKSRTRNSQAMAKYLILLVLSNRRSKIRNSRSGSFAQFLANTSQHPVAIPSKYQSAPAAPPELIANADRHPAAPPYPSLFPSKHQSVPNRTFSVPSKYESAPTSQHTKPAIPLWTHGSTSARPTRTSVTSHDV